MRLLCTADLHVGRRPSRLPADTNTSAYSAAAVWESIVEVAITEKVDCLVLAGDTIDHSNRYFEAFGPLQTGLARLTKADITTVAIAGNHDVEVWPRLIQAVGSSHVHFLGKGGNWERFSLKRDGQTVLHIDAWSFPTRHVHESPLETYPFTAPDTTPLLGLIHGDLSQSQSSYAPLSVNTMTALPPDMWIVGHTHASGLVEGSSERILSPGSPQGLDPDETGWHGAWMLDITNGNAPAATPVPIAKVCYEHLTVDAAQLTSIEDLQPTVVEAIRNHLNTLLPQWPQLEIACLRLRLTGQTNLPEHALKASLDNLARSLNEECPTIETIHVRLDTTEVAVSPVIDLATLAKTDDLPGELARLLLQLDSDKPSDDLGRLLDDIAQSTQQTSRATPFITLQTIESRTPHPLPAPAQLLRQEGMRLLSSLLNQKEATT